MTRRSLFHAVILSGVWRAPRQTESKDPDKSRCATADRTVLPRRLVSFVLAFSLACFPAVVQLRAQTQPAPVPANPPDSAEPAPTGTVLFSRDANSPGAQPTVSPNPAAPTSAPAQSDPLAVTDAERSALTFTAYDLDVHLTPASAAISVRAGLTVRNDGPAPLTRLILQISSSLHWDALSTRSLPSGPTATPPLRRPPHRHRRRPHRQDERSRHHAAASSRSRRVPLAHRALLRRNPALRRTPHAASARPATRPSPPTGTPSLPPSPPCADSATSSGFPPPRRPSSSATAHVSSSPSAAPACATPPQPSASASPSSTLATRPTQPSSAATASRSPPSATTPTCPRPSLPASPPPPSTPSRSASARPASSSPTAPPARPERPPTPPSSPPSPITTTRSPPTPPPPHWSSHSSPTGSARSRSPRLTILDHPGQPFEDDALLVRPMRSAEPATLAPALAHSLTHALDSLHPSLDRRGPRPVPLAPLDRAHRWPRRRAHRTAGRRPPTRPRRTRSASRLIWVPHS